MVILLHERSDAACRRFVHKDDGAGLAIDEVPGVDPADDADRVALALVIAPGSNWPVA